MCLPALAAAAPVIGMATSVAGLGLSAMQYSNQMGMMQAEAVAQNQYHEDNKAAANAAAATSYAHQQNRMVQEEAAASLEKQNLEAEGLAARSRANVAAGEAGVQGISVDALINDYYGQQGRHETALNQNQQMQRGYLMAEMDATQAQAVSRINSVRKAII